MNADLTERTEKIFSLIFHDVPPENIRRLTRLNALHWDSLAHLNLVISLEEEFKISISPEETSSMTSFESTLALVLEKLHAYR